MWRRSHRQHLTKLLMFLPHWSFRRLCRQLREKGLNFEKTRVVRTRWLPQRAQRTFCKPTGSRRKIDPVIKICCRRHWRRRSPLTRQKLQELQAASDEACDDPSLVPQAHVTDAEREAGSSLMEEQEATAGCLEVESVPLGLMECRKWFLETFAASSMIATAPAEECRRDGKTMFLPSELWPLLLEFLPVAEVAYFQTRAVSHFFSNSKVWVAHLFKLMDLDSLPEHCAGDGRHPGLEFEKYHDALCSKNFENAEETKRNASEGFQGYRIWINGLFMWHKSHPELSLHFLQTATQWCGSKQIELSNPAYTLCRAVRELGIRDLTLPLAKGLLGVLDTETRPQKCMSVLSLVKTCQAIYRHLDIKVVFKLLESMMSWKDQKVRMEAICMVATVLEAILMDDEAFARACRRFTSMENADKKGNMDEAAAEKKKLIGLLKDSKLRS